MTVSRRQSVSRNEIMKRPKAVPPLPLQKVSRYKSPNPNLNMTLPLELVPNISYESRRMEDQYSNVQFIDLKMREQINIPTSDKLMEIYQSHMLM